MFIVKANAVWGDWPHGAAPSGERKWLSECVSALSCMNLFIANGVCVFSSSFLVVAVHVWVLQGHKVTEECVCVRIHMCVKLFIRWRGYVEGFWGVLVFLLPAGGLLPASSLINSPLSASTHTHTHTRTASYFITESVREV